jgi:hypothetical protein
VRVEAAQFDVEHLARQAEAAPGGDQLRHPVQLLADVG